MAQSFRLSNRLILLVTTLGAIAFAVGFGAAASLTVSSGASENGGGTYHATSALSYFPETITGVGIQSSALPTTLSGSAASPTVLAAVGTAYSLNSPVAGDFLHFWKFTESTGAPASTELEVQFTVTTGTTTVTTVYLETQASIPGSAQVFAISYDLGAPTSTITLNSVLEIAQQCPSVGTCP